MSPDKTRKVVRNILPWVGVVVVVQNDSETIEQSLASYYPYVQRILVSTDLHRGWSGEPVVADDTLDRIRAFDVDCKVTVLTGDYYHFDDPMRNDTYQRQCAVDALAAEAPFLHWIMQVDADEIFLNFPRVLEVLRQDVPWSTRCVYWNWVQVYNTLDDGRSLLVVNEDGSPKLERFPLAQRRGNVLRLSRYPHPPRHDWGGRLRWEYEGGTAVRDAVLHYSWAKSEERMREKLRTWSHSHDFDTGELYEQWRGSKVHWAEMKDFHPFQPGVWPALRPFTQAELDDFLSVSRS